MRKPWTTRPDTPWWVSAFTDIGRPLMSVVVLVLCAPGEQHLARMAGWTPALAWGMAGLLAAYAGIAAVVATVRPKGAPGKRSAVAGAVLALLLAMAAQPVSHLFVTGWLSDTPRAPVWLIVTVSTVPPLVLGHLLHLAAGHPDVSAGQRRTAEDSRTAQDSPGQPVRRAGHFGPAVSVSGTTRTGHPAGQVSLDKPAAVRPVRAAVRPIGTASGVSALVRELVSAGHTDTEVKDIVSAKLPDTKPDTLSKTIRRVRSARTA